MVCTAFPLVITCTMALYLFSISFHGASGRNLLNTADSNAKMDF